MVVSWPLRIATLKKGVPVFIFLLIAYAMGAL